MRDVRTLIGSMFTIKKVSDRYYTTIEHDSLIIDTKFNRWYWNSISKSGGIVEWIQLCKKEGWKADVSKAKEFVAPAIQPAKEVAPLDMALAERYHYALKQNDKALAWWKEAGVTRRSIDRFMLGYKESISVYVDNKPVDAGPGSSIPFFKRGSLKTIRHRIWTADKNRYMPEKAGLGIHLWNSDALDSNSDSVTLVEGEKKGIVLSQYEECPVCAFVGLQIFPPQDLETIKRFKTVYLVPDPGTNLKGVNWINLLAQQQELRIIRLPMKVDDFIKDSSDQRDYYFRSKRNSKVWQKLTD